MIIEIQLSKDTLKGEALTIIGRFPFYREKMRERLFLITGIGGSSESDKLNGSSLSRCLDDDTLLDVLGLLDNVLGSLSLLLRNLL